MSDKPDLESLLNPQVPHSARLWNYLLGGKDNFAADREAAEHALALICTARRPDPTHPGITDKVSEFAAVARKA